MGAGSATGACKTKTTLVVNWNLLGVPESQREGLSKSQDSMGRTVRTAPERCKASRENKRKGSRKAP